VKAQQLAMSALVTRGEGEVEAQMIATHMLVISRTRRAARPKAGDGISSPAAWS
jgi:hypothetical protein